MTGPAFLETLSGALADVESFRAFLLEFGWELDPSLDAAGFGIVRQIFADEIALLDTLPSAEPKRLRRRCVSCEGAA